MRQLEDSENGEPGHKKKEKNPARHPDNTTLRNCLWKFVVEFDGVKSTGTG